MTKEEALKSKAKSIFILENDGITPGEIHQVLLMLIKNYLIVILRSITFLIQLHQLKWVSFFFMKNF
jgi:hypothetical protein